MRVRVGFAAETAREGVEKAMLVPVKREGGQKECESAPGRYGFALPRERREQAACGWQFRFGSANACIVCVGIAVVSTATAPKFDIHSIRVRTGIAVSVVVVVVVVVDVIMDVIAGVFVSMSMSTGMSMNMLISRFAGGVGSGV